MSAGNPATDALSARQVAGGEAERILIHRHAKGSHELTLLHRLARLRARVQPINAPVARADVIYNTLGPGDSHNGFGSGGGSGMVVGCHGGGVTTLGSAAFQVGTGSDYQMDSIEVAMRRLGQAAHVQVRLVADLAGAPDEKVLESFHPQLMAGAQYWLVVSPESSHWALRLTYLACAWGSTIGSASLEPDAW